LALVLVLWDAAALRSGASFFSISYGLICVVFILVVVAGPFADARRRARTIYAVTSERIIIHGGVSSRKTTSCALATLTDINLKEEPDGSGTINFGPRGLAAIFAGAKWPLPTFELIPGARGVYSIILEARRAALA
jgi:Bacterial PH domain